MFDGIMRLTIDQLEILFSTRQKMFVYVYIVYTAHSTNLKLSGLLFRSIFVKRCENYKAPWCKLSQSIDDELSSDW